ncbi:Protein ERGIC-53 [Cricetulus griseus]|uniref:Protein ERGIC-53 n=1 Tax=Cricetulus griseus TaxID=10029 RepID=G3HUI7_CRIGR|nr:Protein ERGIC-53 [Cricetulus griseus]
MTILRFEDRGQALLPSGEAWVPDAFHSSTVIQALNVTPRHSAGNQRSHGSLSWHQVVNKVSIRGNQVVDAIPSSDQIRIAPSLKSQRGSVWTKTKAAFENWEVEVTFRVTGRGRIGADGLAIWYTENQGLDGPVFGSADMWNGVGIFFDSFDNDGKPTLEKDISEKEKEKYQEEFEHFQQELDKKKEEFQKGHPDLQGQPADDVFESVGDRELRQVFEGQNRIHLEIKQLNRQLDMILDEQRRYVSSLTEEISRRGAGTPGQPGQVSQQELDTVVKTQHEILRQVNEMKNSMSETVRLVSGIQHPGSAGVYETTQHFMDIKEHLHVVKRDIDNLAQRNMPSNEKPKCPELPPFPSCLSTIHFVIFVVVQTVLFIGYIMYRTQQEAAAKKFF